MKAKEREEGSVTKLKLTKKGKKLEAQGARVMLASQILYVMFIISGYFVYAATLKDFSPPMYFDRDFLWLMAGVLSICLIVAGIKMRRDSGVVFLTGCILLLLLEVFNWGSFLISISWHSLFLNYVLRLIGGLLPHFTFSGMIIFFVLLYIKRKGGIPGIIFASSHILLLLNRIYGSLNLSYFSIMKEPHKAGLLVYRSLYPLCAIMIDAGFLLLFLAYGFESEV